MLVSLPPEFNFAMNKDFSELKKSLTDKTLSYSLDFSATTRVDSAALGMLLVLRKHLGGDEANIKLINCNKFIRELLEVANFEKLFKIA